MIERSVFKKIGFFTFLLASIGLSGCLDSNPATPPAPPAELPAALTFPQDVGIDVGKIQSSESSALALVGTSGQFSNQISEGAHTATIINDILKNNLSLLSGLEIPVSNTTTIFSVTTTVTRPEEFGGGKVNAMIKIDFSDYDLDGDGVKEGCSGHTAATPICFRLWWNQERFMAGIFEKFPTETNPGSGRFRMAQSQDKERIVGEDLLMAAIYDHSDSENKTADLFGVGSSVGSGEDLAEHFEGHINLNQSGEDAIATKQVRMSAKYSGASARLAEYQYVGSWKEDNDFWSGSTTMVPADTFSGGDLLNVCARISTADEVARTNCLDLGIDVEGIEFVSTPTEKDVELPDDFPETPTF